ncbi:MAG: hypothetical protein WDA60_12605 [Acidimicrobiia bacterium]
MSAAISVLASDAPSAAIALYGTFDTSNLGFLERHLNTLEGDVVIDCTNVSSLADEAVTLLNEFRAGAARVRRRVVIRPQRREPSLVRTH